jgi:hypothetical protein
LARRLDMTPRTVQIWFQNKRQAARKCYHIWWYALIGRTLIDVVNSPSSQWIKNLCIITWHLLYKLYSQLVR